MHNILAVDTSSGILSVSAQNSEGSKIEINLDAGFRHGERLVLLIKQALADLHINKKDLDILACGIGPGSFTGLRIGLSAMKALALGLKKKVCTFSSLDLIAGGISLVSGKLAVAVNAKRERVYAAIYEFKNGAAKKILKDSSLGLNELLDYADEDTVFTGDAISAYGEIIKKRLGRKIVFLEKQFWFPKASAALSMVEAANGKIQASSLARLKPAYLRLSEAEERRKELSL